VRPASDADDEEIDDWVPDVGNAVPVMSTSSSVSCDADSKEMEQYDKFLNEAFAATETTRLVQEILLPVLVENQNLAGHSHRITCCLGQ